MRKNLLFVLVLVLLLAACSQPEQPQVEEVPQEATAMEGEAQESPASESGGDEAPQEQAGEAISGLAVVENAAVTNENGAYVATVSGNLPDGCTMISGVSQMVSGSTIEITVQTERPAEMMCTAALVPFSETVTLETAGLAAGEYSVAANGVTANETVMVGENGEGEGDADAAEMQIQDIVWQWESASDGDQGEATEVADPESYTVTLLDDGQAPIKADCNQLIVSYTLDGSSLVFNMLGPSTLAFCGEESLDSRFLSLLGSVSTWQMDGERLQLSTTGGAVMTFASGGPPPGSFALDPQQISLETQGLPYSWQPVVVPLQPYDESQPPGPQGLPEHMEILFGAVEAADRQPGDPVMMIIPVDSYRLMYEMNDNRSVTETMARIAELAYALPDPAPTSGYPALPQAPYTPVVGFNDLTVQVAPGTPNDMSASKNGYRAVSRWAQDANPVTNQGLTYTYQGFTNDGRYLVSFFYPVTTDALMDAAELTQEESDAFYADPQAAIGAGAQELNQLSPSDFQPDLATLDALVASLQIEGMVSSGVQGREWQWVEVAAAGAEAEAIETPEAYSVTFDDAGGFTFVADCNRGGGSYSAEGGFNGQIALQAGPMTLAACPPESRSDNYLNALFAVDEFRLLPGGTGLELLLPAGGGALRFALAGTAPVELPEPEAGEATGTVIAEAGANVRLGPGTDYPSMGVAPLGTTGTIIGMSQDQQWWAFDVPQSPSVMGWVLSSLVAAENTDNVMVVQAPARPTPEPTPTAAPPSPTIQFSANPQGIAEGECTELVWSVENIQAVWVYPAGADFKQYPVTGSGNQSVCPATTTTYEMRVQHTDERVEFRTVTIFVEPSITLSNTSWVVSTLYGQFPLPGSSLTAYFGGDGTFGGNGGCNTLRGPYTAGDGTIAIGPLAGTLMSCGEALDQQEQAYSSALQAARSFTIEGSQLTLFDSAQLELARLIIVSR